MTRFKSCGNKRLRGGFSLLETMGVLTGVLMLASVSLPAVNSLANQTARVGAANLLLEAFEQARVSALSNGTNAYIGFANENLFPERDSEYPYRAFVIFRDRKDSDPGSGQFVPLSRWQFLPKNISFKRERFSIVGAPPAGVPYALALSDMSIPRLKTGDRVPVVVFGPNGSIQNPSQPNELRLFLYQGFFSNGRDNLASRSTGWFERVTLQRSTGRAQLDVTTTE
ncbi:MAG: hypothetical protein PHD76_01340 [Methylacidiphilales bacterium]|nr:hypothetical protein [Candidatus Methylacidiphilales bacterium]